MAPSRRGGGKQAEGFSADVYEATEGFSCDVDGVPTVIPAGTRVRAGHPLMAGREQFFAPLEIQYDVEAATKEPGEKRGAK
jgi:hypothetical protein